MEQNALTVGWIGAGRMGAAMAIRLDRAGAGPSVWNRTRSKAEATGCSVADEIADLRDRDVVFTMVSTPADLEEVLLGAGGLLADPAQLPKIVVDCSTVSTESSELIRAAVRRCAVSSSSPRRSAATARWSRSGGLTLCVSGPEATFRKVEHLLRHIGKSVTYVGDGDVARLVKICHNLMLGVVTQCLAEITVLAEKGGVSRAAFLEFLNDSVMGSVFTRYKSPAFVHLDYTPTFTPILLRKDFDLGLAAAHELDVPMPLAAITAQLVQGIVSSGRVTEDFAVLLDQQAAASGLDAQAGGHAGGRRSRERFMNRPLAAPGHTGVDYENPRRLRPAAPLPPRARAEGAGRLGVRRVPALRLLQHPLYDPDLDRRRAGRQDDPVRAAHPLGRAPTLWDFGSAARHHKLFAPWLDPADCRPGMLGMRGAIAPTAGLMESAVREIKGMLTDAGLADMPVGVDIVEPPFLFEMQRQGLKVVDAQQLMLDARLIKSADEIMLLNQAAAMVDGVYQDIVEALKPGVRENEIVAMANKRLYEMGSDQVEAVNAVSGERCNPHPHNFTDRIIRPGDQAFFDIIHSYNGYRTCYYRTLGVGSSTPSQRDAYTKGARMDGRGDRGGPARRRDRRDRGGLAGRDRVRLRERDGRVRPAVRARARAGSARAADHLAAQQHEGAGRAPGRHGVRAGDVLPGE